MVDETGADMSVAGTTVATMFSPQIIGVTGAYLAPGDVLNSRRHEREELWDEVRERITNEKPYIVMGACFDRRQNDPRKDQRCEVEGTVLLSFAMEVYETQLAQGRHFLDGSPRTKALREHPRWREISGNRCAPGLEMHSWTRPTRHLSSAPELFVGGAGQWRGAQVSHFGLFRDPLRFMAAQRRREGAPTCQRLQ